MTERPTLGESNAMRTNSYQGYEVGAGWVDPRRLADRLTGVLRAWRTPDRKVGWLGPLAISLLIVSWWTRLPTDQVIVWLYHHIVHLLR